MSCVCLCLIRLDFVYDLFEHVLSRNKQDTLKSSVKHRRPTVSSQFKVSADKHVTIGVRIRTFVLQLQSGYVWWSGLK